MSNPSVEQIVEMHNDIIEDFGGASGIRELATIENLVYYRLEYDCTIYLKAAIVLHTICTEHPFVDGNKRTAFVAADNILREGGLTIRATNEEVVEFMLEVAKYTHTVDSVEKWISERTESQVA
jgi:death-on-curing protein